VTAACPWVGYNLNFTPSSLTASSCAEVLHRLAVHKTLQRHSTLSRNEPANLLDGLFSNQPKLICPIQATTAFCPVSYTFEQLYAQNASSGKRSCVLLSTRDIFIQ